jgi:hypothetical protein
VGLIGVCHIEVVGLICVCHIEGVGLIGRWRPSVLRSESELYAVLCVFYVYVGYSGYMGHT